MNLYLVERTDNDNPYLEFVSFICAAETDSEARSIRPGDDERSWQVKPHEIRCTQIGIATPGRPPGVILAEFISE